MSPLYVTYINALADGRKRWNPRVLHTHPFDKQVPFTRYDPSRNSSLLAAEKQWDEVLRINTKGVFFCYKYAAKQMVAQGRPGGRIIGASSFAGKQGKLIPLNLLLNAPTHNFSNRINPHWRIRRFKVRRSWIDTGCW